MTSKGLYRLFGIGILVIRAQIAYAQVDINRMEYFIDTDPGVGNGTAVAITVGPNVTESITIPASSLTLGFHTVYFRIQDQNNVWSVSESRSFYISESNITTQSNIVAVEYFIDTDPGYGAGTSLPLTAATNVNLTPLIPTAALSAGFHTLYVRALDSDGIWGDMESRSFYISTSDLSSQANIMAMEYYIDSDPGTGSATAIPITSATNINVTVTINTSALAAGHHALYIRALDQDGVWSEIESRSFYLDAFSSGKIAGIEYFFNSDPGYGNAASLAILPVKDSIDSVVNVPTVPLTAGTHVLGMRIVSDNGTIGMTDYFNVTLCDGAAADFISDVVCVSGSTSFTDASLNVQVGDSVKWDFDNDGVFEVKYITTTTAAGNQSFAYPAEGLYTAKLVIDRAGCISTDSIQVSIEGIPLSDAGTDQALCTTSTTLAGNVPSINESGTWSVFAGVANLTDTTDPTTVVDGLSSTNVELVWTVTNDLAGCSASDTVIITPNLPIIAASATETVDIGQTVITDIAPLAIINSGDVLTSTITMNPLYGLATVLADGTIEYTPDLDVTTNDSILYRITNQCTNFDENYITYTVLNAPPVINNAASNPILTATNATLDLTTIISDPNNNIDFGSITIITQPSSGAVATVDANGVITIDYSGITFSGTDQIEIQVCDLSGVCVTQFITIPGVEVGGENPPITVFNGVSPDGDGYNDFLEIENIEFYPDNTVIILNRWGVQIEKFTGYNNQDIVFKNAELPTGTYYYHIIPGINDVEPVTGHFLLLIE